MKQSRYMVSWLALLASLALPALACNLTSPPEPTPAPTATAPAPTATAVPPTPAPTPTEIPDPLAGFIRYESEALGLAVRYPEAWFAAEEGDRLTIVSDSAMLVEDDFTRGVGVILAGDSDIGILSPGAILELFTSPEAGLLTHAEVIREPRSILVRGQQAIQATYDAELNGERVRATITVVVQGSAAVVAAALTPSGGNDALEPVLTTIVNSIEVLGAPAPQTEGEIRIGETVSGAIPVNGSVVWTFTVGEGETVNVVVLPSDDLDVVLDVRNAEGASVVTDGPIDESFGKEETGNLSLSAGTYMIVLAGFGDSSGTYSLGLTAGFSSLDAIPIQPGDVLEGSLKLGEMLGYAFDALEGGEYAFTVTPAGDLDVVLTVLSSNGTQLDSQDNAFGEESYYFYPPVDGAYTLVISSYDGSPGTFAVALALNPPVSGAGLDLPLVPKDGVFVDESNSLASGEVVEYRVPGLELSPLTIVVNPEEGLDVVIDVYDSDGTLVLTQDRAFSYEEVLFIPDKDDDYRVVVSGFEGSAGIFEVAIFRGGIGGVGFVGSVIATGDNLADGEDEHAYPFYALSADPALALVYPISQLDVVVDVIDGDTDAAVRSVDVNFGYERVLFLPEADRDYFFNVRGYEGDSGSYDIFLAGGPDIVFELANEDVVYGNLGEAGLLLYTYNALAGETLTIVVDPLGDLDVVVEIEPLDGEAYVSADDGLAGGQETAAYTFLQDEVVLIIVRGFDGASGRLRMTVDVQ